MSFLDGASSAQVVGTAFNSPPERSAHSPRRRLMASTRGGSFTTNTPAVLHLPAWPAVCYRNRPVATVDFVGNRQAGSRDRQTYPSDVSHSGADSTMSVYLGIDIGTSGTKTLAMNAKGKLIGTRQRKIPLLPSQTDVE